MLRSLFADVAGKVLRRNTRPGGDFASALEEGVRNAILGLVNRGPKPTPVFDYELVAYAMAAAEAASYFVERMARARNLVGRSELLEFALGECDVDGLVLEFGVYRGASLRFLAQRTDRIVHGFDSFEGLPEDWTHFQKKGRFSLDGNVPEFDEPNIRTHAGRFADTLPGFLVTHPGPVRFAHVDCDLYSSTAEVLSAIAPRLVRGSVLVFDEYLNYPGWKQHEFRAFQEFVAAHSLRYDYLGFASAHSSVAVRIA